MSSLTYRSPQLPWADNKQEHLFKIILLGFLVLTLIMGIIVPNINLPNIEREKLEKVPAQLANVIKRKKEAPKPKLKPKPKVIEKKIEKKPEVKKEAVKAQPKPKPKVAKAKPKPKPRPQRVVKKERTSDRIKAAKAKAEALIANISNDLEDMQGMLDMSSLSVDSASLSNDGSITTDTGSVIDQSAVARIDGINESGLTRATGAENLKVADRDTTKVQELAKNVMSAPQDKKLAGMSRSQMQINRVFERNLSRFTRIYKKALRSNPALEGTVTLGVTISASGDVSSCKVNASDLQDKGVEKRMIMTCKKLSFDTSKSEDRFEFPLTFAP
jgi:protein TonB